MATVEEILTGLNVPQREAVLHRDGPMLVLAGAGSGKTRVVTRRVANLLATGVKAHEILALTFTNKAAAEMRERVERLVGESRVLMCTFHSFCARMLRRYATRLGYTSSYTIYDTDDTTRLMKDVLGGLELSTENFRPASVSAAISLAKNAMVTPDLYIQENTDFFGKNVARVYERYEQRMRAANAMDFDDLLIRMVELLEGDQEAKDELARRFRYVLVDEYQDTNRAQYRIVRALTQGSRNLHVTGDPDQSIYGWRGADIGNILSFERDYPGARVVRLEQNYRSTQVILDAAHGVISHNTRRKEKELWSEHKAGAKVVLEELPDEESEAAWVVEEIEKLLSSGTPANEVAVFYRVNALSRNIEMELLERKIKYAVVAGTAFYERKEVRDVLGYLKALVNPADDVSLGRVLNVPTRGIGNTTIETLERFAGENRLSLWEACRRVEEVKELGVRARGAVGKFMEMMEELRAEVSGPVESLVKLVIERTGYMGYLHGDPKAEERLENVAELVNAAGALTLAQPEATAVEFLEQVTLVSDVDALDEDRPAVSLMTLHTAKGLEFAAVFMIGMEEGLLPHELSRRAGDQDLEEERRLCFVGFTRAKKRLHLSRAWSRFHYGTRQNTAPSRFLAEIPKRCLEEHGRPGMSTWSPSGSVTTVEKRLPGFAPGDRVRHAVYGVGRVEEVTGEGPRARIKVIFSGVPKTFVLEYAGLKKV